ncbi:MAG: endonuclease [Leptotrichia sp.]|uniref:Endonuclease/exonuclease/phosphatase family protein n=1 Tax=Leptotrichia rugosa TaxID=3239302 RepID=A0AB39VHX5_9FUSO|nr:endonuclease/exonuclease/phosphatase family protein [Leptotrichia sp. oral taxon 498]ASQ48926.1 endonuclease [Leptotrichia sp. oral taxon 498]RKW35259.1 MAG: endonuclease [Leptotrichia sp.]
MKLLTINTHAWLEENQDEKMEILAKTIAEKQYDVIAMQEVNQLMNSPVIYDGIRNDNYGWKLLEKLEKYTDTDYYYHWSNSHIGFGKYDEGVAIITKHPIKDEDEFYCTFSQSVRVINARRIVSITLDYEGQKVEFYSCHMNLPNCETEDMGENIQTILKRTKNDNLKFLMGDFNTDAIHNQEAYQNIINQGLFDTYELAEKKDSGITVNKKIDGWATSGSEKRLDYIFSNKKVKVLESKVIFNGENKEVVSDHFGLEVKIEL